MATPHSDIHKKILQTRSVFDEKGREEVLPLAREIMEELPDHVGVMLEFASLANLIGERHAAISTLIKARDLEPDNVVVLGELGNALMQDQQLSAAIQVLLSAIDIKPDFWQAYRDLGAIYTMVKHYPEGIPFLRRATELKPSHPESHANLAVCLFRTQQYDEAIKHANKAIKLDPKNEIVYDTIGTALGEQGKTAEAEQYHLKAIKINRLFGPAYSNLALTKKFTDADKSFISKTEKLLGESMSAYNRTYLHFALSKMHNDLGERKKAFEHAQKANLLEAARREESPPPKNALKAFGKIFTSDFFKTHFKIGNPTNTPIFIVGMPRSGTSLIEQIISSHPKASGAGELDDLGLLANEITTYDTVENARNSIQKILSTENIEEITKKYLATLTSGREMADRITDKMPENYFHLGLIKLLFPNARIIHVMRNPLDISLSCYFTPLTHLNWSFNPTWIANRYGYYQKVMKYWRKVIPKENMLEINYEDLITTPEEKAKQIIEFCGLEWDPVCLEFYKTDRSVATASVWQVRQPLYKTSIKRWQQYGPAIRELAGPLAKYLDRDDIDTLKKIGVKIKKGIFL